MDPTLKPQAVRYRSSSIYNADRTRPLYGLGIELTLDASASTDTGVNVDTTVSSDTPTPVTTAGAIDESPFPGFPVMIDGPVGADGTRCGIAGKKYLWDSAWPCTKQNLAAAMAAYYSQSAMSRGYAQTQLRNIAALQNAGKTPVPYDGPGGDGENGQSVWFYQMHTGTEKLPAGLPTPAGWPTGMDDASRARQGAAMAAAQQVDAAARLKAAQLALTNAATKQTQAAAAAASGAVDALQQLRAATAAHAAAQAALVQAQASYAGASKLVGAPMSANVKIAIGLGVLLVGGAAVYFATRKKAA
jgi:hypothetical protein